MTELIAFSVALLQAVASFLGSEPVFYLFGLVLFCFLCKGIRCLISR